MAEYNVHSFDGFNKLEFTTPGGVYCMMVVDHDVTDDALNQEYIEGQSYVLDLMESWGAEPTEEMDKVKALHVYAGGELVRKMWAEGQPENLAIKQQLADAFTEYNFGSVVQNGPKDLDIWNVDKFKRFFMGTEGDKIVLSANLPCPQSFMYLWRINESIDPENLLWAFQIRNDLTLHEKTLVVYLAETGHVRYFNRRPIVPERLVFEASREYSQKGKLRDSELFLYNDHDYIAEFCTGHGKPLPMPQDSELIPYAYGIRFDEVTGTIRDVNAYAYEYF